MDPFDSDGVIRLPNGAPYLIRHGCHDCGSIHQPDEQEVFTGSGGDIEGLVAVSACSCGKQNITAIGYPVFMSRLASWINQAS